MTRLPSVESLATVRRIAIPAAFTILALMLACGTVRAAQPSPTSSPAVTPSTQPAPTASSAQPSPTASPAQASPSSPTAQPSAPPPPMTVLYLTAKRIDFYYDRFLIEADGNVHVRTSDGFTVSGDAFSMDLKLNRFMVAGNVTLHDATGTVNGAAISDFLDFRRIYFVPVSTEPDRWTFLDGDLVHPAKGRMMPGDAFYFPNVMQQPSVTASGAVIGTKTYVRFVNAHTYLGNAPIPLGTDVVNFSSNQYFAQNTLSGASVDLTWTLAGSPNSLTAVHFRYDPTYHTYMSVEQHLVGQHEYAIFSVNPATRYQKWWNLKLYDALGTRFQIQSFTQLFTQQNYVQLPRSSEQTTWLNATYSFPHSYVTATSTLTNYNLLGPGALELPNTIAGNLSHPTQVQISASSFQNKIANLPLFEQIYEGYGFNHDTVGGNQYLNGIYPYWPLNKSDAPIPVPGLQSYGAECKVQPSKVFTYYCPVYTTIWNTVFGFTFYTPALKLNPSAASPYDTFYFNASYTKQYEWNSLPHWIMTDSTNFSISRQFSRAVNTFLAYSILNTGDHYISGGYQPCFPIGPTCPESLTAFRGVSTLRTTALGMNFAPDPQFNFSVLVRHHVDFPIPVPGVFSPPANNILGQPLYNWYLGQPPYDATGEVRFVIFPHALADISRTFYWYGNPYRTSFWQPSFVVQILPI